MAGIAFALVSLLSSPQPGLAEAAVLERASAALAEPKGILYVKESVHGGNVCFGMEMPIRCIDEAVGGGRHGGQARVGLRYRLWMDPSNDTSRTVYRTGDETVVEGHRESLYDPSDNTITVIANARGGRVMAFPQNELEKLTIPRIRSLYREARDGASDAQLLGRRRVRGIDSYELRIAEGSSSYVLLYLNARTFLPVRIIDKTFFRTPRGLIAMGSRMEVVAKMLPSTPENQHLLQVAAHPGAKVVRMSAAQMMAARESEPHRISRSWSAPGK